MRRFLANALSTVGVLAINFCDWTYPMFLRLLNLTHVVARSTSANIIYFLVNKVDPTAIKEAEDNLQLKSQQIELELLASASKVRDDAVANGDWTDDHTEALNAVGNALIGSCNWDEDHVHSYLKGVVESVEGLTYGDDD